MDWGKREKAHVDQAFHNTKLLEFIKKNLGKEFIDWRLVAIFYVCVHCVDAKLAQSSIKTINHPDRNSWVAGRLGAISAEYMRLYTESVNARYDPEYRNHVNETRIDQFEKFMGDVKAIVPVTF